MPITTTQLAKLREAAQEVRNVFPTEDPEQLLPLLLETKEYKASKATPTLALQALYSVTPTVDIPNNPNKQYVNNGRVTGGGGAQNHYHGPVIIMTPGGDNSSLMEMLASAFARAGTGNLNLPALPAPATAPAETATT